MKKKRLAFLLSFILMCNSLMASMVPIRELATDPAAISYTKVNGVGIVTYKENGVELKLNLKTGAVTTNTGKTVNVPIKLENSITYVESEAFKEVVAKERSNKDFLKNLLKQIYTALTTTLSATPKVNNVTKVAEHSSSSSSSSSTTTSGAFQVKTTEYVCNVCLKVWNDDNVILTDGSLKIDTTTSNGLKFAYDNIYINYVMGLEINEDKYYTISVVVNGFPIWNSNMRWQKNPYNEVGWVHTIRQITLSPGDVIEIKSTLGDYKFIYDGYIDYLYQDTEEARKKSQSDFDFFNYGYYDRMLNR